MFPIICPRVGAGVAAHSGKAAPAAARASWTSDFVERGNTPKQSVCHAGFVVSKVPPSLDSVNCPLIMLYPFIFGNPFGLSLSRCSSPTSNTWVMTCSGAVPFMNTTRDLLFFTLQASI